MKLSKEEARRFLIHYQGLTDSDALSGAEGVLAFIKRVGCIQYDPLNIVGRNADLVLQARIKDYRPELLERLLYKDRLLLDGWDKMMSIYLREDWPCFRYVRERRGAETTVILRNRNSQDALLYTDVILRELAQNGPMQPKQLKLGSAPAGRWGHKNLSSAAMDYLFQTGRLGVYEKVKVNKVYAPVEQLLPESLLSAAPFASEQAFCRWYVRRRLGSVGMLWNRDGGGWLGQYLQDRSLRTRILDECVESGLVLRVDVEGISEPFYMQSEALPLLERSRATEPDAVCLLAPLDNLLWDRGMLSALFGFDYSWEVYVPATKRKYGYYVLPLLYGNRFIGRVEPQKSDTHFALKNLWWEKDASVSGRMIERISLEMERFAGCFGKKEGVGKSVYELLRA